ncbi:hypothetical protein G6F31_015164 [Rhizopus arrhizus]|nr:hypothetical protein G6F31_015164 [Rhizopus arrhizus]
MTIPDIEGEADIAADGFACGQTADAFDDSSKQVTFSAECERKTPQGKQAHAGHEPCGTVFFHPDYDRRLRHWTGSADPRRRPGRSRARACAPTAGGELHPALKTFVYRRTGPAVTGVALLAMPSPCGSHSVNFSLKSGAGRHEVATGRPQGRLANGLKFTGIPMRKILIVAALLAAAPFSASADALSYTYVEGGWTQVKVDDNALDDPKVDGAYLRDLPLQRRFAEAGTGPAGAGHRLPHAVDRPRRLHRRRRLGAPER